jgi:hypothetical protein
MGIYPVPIGTAYIYTCCAVSIGTAYIYTNRPSSCAVPIRTASSREGGAAFTIPEAVNEHVRKLQFLSSGSGYHCSERVLEIVA